MPKSRLIRSLGVAAVSFLSLGLACRSGDPQQARAERVVMVSFDGVGADLAREWLDQGVAAEVAPFGYGNLEQVIDAHLVSLEACFEVQESSRSP